MAFRDWKKYILIYNPEAGDTSFKNKLDLIIYKLQQKKIQVVPYRTFSPEDVQRVVLDLDEVDFQGILVSGGDGTINQVVNGMLKNNLHVPLGIFPSGTANDFANSLCIPRNVGAACDIITAGEVMKVDVGFAGQDYFINVVSGGLISEIAHTVDINLKHALGKIAYYLKGVGQLPKFKPYPLEVIADKGVFKSDVFLFLVLNSSIAGGFRNLAPKASLSDGLLDVLVFKSCNLAEFLALFVRVLQGEGEHIKSLNVEYFQAKELVINSPSLSHIELDGELGPGLPLNIVNLQDRLKVWVPFQEK